MMKQNTKRKLNLNPFRWLRYPQPKTSGTVTFYNGRRIYPTVQQQR